MSDRAAAALEELLGARYRPGVPPVAAPQDARELARVLSLLRDHGLTRDRDVRVSREGLAAIAAPNDEAAILQAGAGAPLEQVEVRANRAGLSLGPLSPGAMRLDVAGFVEGAYAGLRAIPGGRLEPVPLALDALMHDGLVYASHPSPRSAAGPDLDALFLGGQGAAGVLLGATLRLVPKPPVARDLGYGFADGESLAGALRDAIAAGCWVSNARVQRSGDRLVLGLRVLGTTTGVERDVASLARCAAARGAPPVQPGRWSELPEAEVELSWSELPACLERGPVSLFRLSLETVIARGAADRGLRLDVPGEWALPAAISAALGGQG